MNTAEFLQHLIEQSRCDAVNIRMVAGQAKCEVSVFEGNDVHVVDVSADEWNDTPVLLADILLCLEDMRAVWKRGTK